MKCFHAFRSWLGLALGFTTLGAPTASAADQAQFGQAWSRNMISSERQLPEEFDLRTGRHVKWSAHLGTETHSTPVVAGGRIFVGTNNGSPRDHRHEGDRGVLMCFNEADGRFLWQLVVPKRTEDTYFDWPNSGISSTASVEGDRVYVVDNRGVVLCLDVHGFANGNDGPFLGEAIYYAPQPTNELAQGVPVALFPDGRLRPDFDPAPRRVETGPLDADIIWLFDLTSGAGIWSHDAAHSSILIHGDHLYLNTGTGVDNTHRRIRRPDAPSLVVLDKHTGRFLAREREGIGPNIFHSTWSPPSLAVVAGVTQVCFAAGNGIVYGFEPLPPANRPDPDPPSPSSRPPGGGGPAALGRGEGTSLQSENSERGDNRPVPSLKKLWEFDFDPSAPKTGVHRFHLNKREGPSNFYGAPVFHQGRLYVAGGGDLWWGKNEAWLRSVELAPTGPRLRWSYPLVRHTFSTAAVVDGLVFIGDCSQNLHCIDTDTGQRVWTHDLQGETWASPWVADGKVYIGTRRGWFHILSAGREKRVLFEAQIGAPISATAVAANGVLFVATMTDLYAIARTP